MGGRNRGRESGGKELPVLENLNETTGTGMRRGGDGTRGRGVELEGTEIRRMKGRKLIGRWSRRRRKLPLKIRGN